MSNSSCPRNKNDQDPSLWEPRTSTSSAYTTPSHLHCIKHLQQKIPFWTTIGFFLSFMVMLNLSLFPVHPSCLFHTWVFLALFLKESLKVLQVPFQKMLHQLIFYERTRVPWQSVINLQIEASHSPH